MVENSESVKVFNEMKEIIENFLADGEVWESKGTKASAGRMRKSTLALDKLGKVFRKASVAEAKQ